MTEPNEEVNEELSTEELKSVSGGMVSDVDHPGTLQIGTTSGGTQITTTDRYWGGDIPHSGGGHFSPHGSGFGGTREDWEKIKGEKSKFKGSYIR